MKINIKTIVRDPNGRFILLDTDIYEQNVLLLDIYAPTKDHVTDQIQTILSIHEKLEDLTDKPLIMAGDFNTCLNPEIDKLGGRNEKTSHYTKTLTDFMETVDVNDIWRVRNPDSKRYTRRQNTKAGMVHSRIDFFLTSTNLSYFIQQTYIESGLLSDHSVIGITISLDLNSKI
jgi:exonuclease III